MRGCVVLAVELLRQQLCHRWRDVASAQRNRANGFDDFFRVALFVQIATRALADHVHGVMLFGVAAQDQDAHVRRFGPQHGQCVQATLARHRQVHDQDVDFSVAHQINRLAPIGRLSSNAEIDVLAQKLTQAGTYDGVVIHNANFDH